MSKRTKEITIILIISALLAGLSIGFIFIFPDEMLSSDGLAFSCLMPFWAFGTPAAYAWFVRWLNGYGFETTFWLGYVFGLLLFIVPLLIAPFLAVVYFMRFATDKTYGS